jgi:hypothetical protein
LKYQDNYYCDGFSIRNEAGYYGDISAEYQPAFNDWFRDSILRPTVPSYSIGDPGNTYPTDAFQSDASGRAVFIPMRNPRPVFNPHLHNLDSRDYMKYGVILINCAVMNLQISGSISFEGVFNGDDTSTAYFTFGSCQNGVISAPYTNLGYVEVTHPLIGWTGRGLNAGGTGYSEKLDWLGKPL